MRIQFITEQIALGGAIGSAENLELIMDKGISHVLNLDRRCDIALVNKERLHNNGIEILHYYKHDDGKPKGAIYWSVCVEFVLRALSLPKSKVFIHCAAGQNRSVSVFYAVMRRLGHSADSIIDMIKRNYTEPLRKRDSDFNEGRVRYKEDIDLWLARC